MLHTMTNKEVTAHIRGRVKASGIKARVRMEPSPSFGEFAVQIIAPSFDKPFTGEEMRRIAEICQANRLTQVRGGAIDLDLYAQLSSHQVDFYMPLKR